uniref:Peptidase M3A/M3B catalytic domain-containing protein n=2 Tax=Compsopogon caeruleus TaxID=31354 RepID=A0A7S1TFZ1_9RHOD|mmetsp:Transcript_522/g.991  ORF Transcript_522/g.991 Transcript_522/m.991 type:complete len:669 (+) Transcript_522:211-2217(+)
MSMANGGGLRIVLDPTGISDGAEQVIATHREVLDGLVAVGGSKWTVSELRRLAEAEMDLSADSSAVTFGSHVSTEKVVRDSAAKAEEKIDAYLVESSMRKDLYESLVAFEARIGQEPDLSAQVTAEEKRMLDRLLRDFVRNGVALGDETRDRFMAVKKRLSELSIEFSKNLNEESSRLAFSRQELDGMQEDYLASLKRDDDGNFLVSLKYPEVLPLLRYCKVEETRRRMDVLNSSKCQDINVPLLEEALKLRFEMANLLGYQNFAAFQLEIRMAKDPETVAKFLNDLRQKLEPLAVKEHQRLLTFKKAEKEACGEAFDGELHPHDMMYYHTRLLDEAYQIDDEEIKKYFPLSKVVSGSLEIYQRVLGLRFEQDITRETWHDEVSCYAVYDQASEEFMGNFYLDLHPRDGKYGHAAVFPLQRAADRENGIRQKASCAMLCNFTPSTEARPSLLKHSEVVTFFHEMGHVFHNICTEVKMHYFSGTRVERDFVEAPSQMLENWCFEAESLELMSGHFETGEPLPDHLLRRIKTAKNVNTGLLNLRQIFFGVVDQTLHMSAGDVDTQQLWAQLRKDITMFAQAPGTNPSGGFGHIMGGYQASYYGYLYSEVFSADLFSKFASSSPLDQELGFRYRKSILAPGGSVDGLETVKNFLGREPNQESFLKQIGVTP